MKKILIIRTDRIGDLVLTTPAVSVLKRNFPESSISALVNPYAKDIAALNPYIAEVIADKPFFKLLAEVKARKFDACIVFFVNFKTALLAFLSGIPVTIGPASKIWSVLFKKMVFQRRSRVNLHEADFNIDLLKALKIKPSPAKPQIRITEAAKKSALSYLNRKFGITGAKPLALLHPGSGGSARDWPPKCYASLVTLLKTGLPQADILLTGTAKERPLLEKIAAMSSAHPAFMDEELALGEFAALIACAKVLVTNSTGPLHIATAVNVPTVSFFPPVKGCLPSRWGPYGDGHIVLSPRIPSVCPKCIGGACSSYDCMEMIKPETAFEAVKKQLSRTAA